MYTIVKRFRFEAAHQLNHLPQGHKCGNVHGHSYNVEVAVWGRQLDAPEEWIMDFSDFAPFKNWVDTTLDHKFLNDVVDFQTTSENLARYLFDAFEKVVPIPAIASLKYVRVAETESTFAEYSR